MENPYQSLLVKPQKIVDGMPIQVHDNNQVATQIRNTIIVLDMYRLSIIIKYSIVGKFGKVFDLAI